MRLKNIVLLIVATALLFATPAAAQNDVPETKNIALPADTMVTAANFTDLPFPDFSLHAPGFDGCALYGSGLGGSQWRLHEGFNAQLSLGISAGFGKGAWRGVGFNQSAAFAYAVPLSERFSLAGGVYAHNMDWGSWRETDAGVAALLAFRAGERVNLYAYATKSLMPRQSAWRNALVPPYLRTMRDRIGAMAEFKLGKGAYIQVSVERSRQ